MYEPYFFEYLAILIRVTFLTASFDEKKYFDVSVIYNLHCNSLRLNECQIRPLHRRV